MNTHPRRLFLDIDGTLAIWREGSKYEDFLQPGYAQNLPPHQNLVEAVKWLAQCPLIAIYVVSAYIVNHENAVIEKNHWLDEHIPIIDKNHRIFCVTGQDKRNIIPNGIRATDVLLDDYSYNLHLWAQSAKGIKVLNGVNATKGTWDGATVSVFESPDALAQSIYQLVMCSE